MMYKFEWGIKRIVAAVRPHGAAGDSKSAADAGPEGGLGLAG